MIDPGAIWQPWCHPSPLSPAELHLYRFRLDGSVKKWLKILSADEMTRAECLLDPHKKSCFISARGQLRQILSHYLKLTPAEIIFEYNLNGKPSIAPSHHSDLSFNLSHSANIAVVAVTQNIGIGIGIDIEQIDDALSFQSLADQFFNKEELQVLQKASPNRKRRTFYRLWTIKEAQLKMAGVGFSQQQTVKTLPAYLSHFYLLPHFVSTVAGDKNISLIRKIDFNR